MGRPEGPKAYTLVFHRTSRALHLHAASIPLVAALTALLLGSSDPTTLLYSEYLRTYPDPTEAAERMLADAANTASPASAVFDVPGTTELVRGLVVDAPLHVVVRDGVTLRAADGATFPVSYESRVSGRRYTGLLLFRRGAGRARLEVYGHLDPNASGTVDGSPSAYVPAAVMAVGVHHFQVEGYWTASDAYSSLRVIDSDHVLVRGRIGGVPPSAPGKGGNVLGLEGTQDFRSEAVLWGRGVGEVVDLNAGNVGAYIAHAEGEQCGEVVDINNARDVIVGRLVARNCRTALMMFSNTGPHLSRRPDVPLEDRSGIVVERADIEYDADLRFDLDQWVFRAYLYRTRSSYPDIRVRVRGADPARFQMNGLIAVGPDGGEVGLDIESDVEIPFEWWAQVMGRDNAVRVRATVPVPESQSVVRVEGRGHTFEEPSVSQAGPAAPAQRRTGIDASESTDILIEDPAIRRTHFAFPIVPGRGTRVTVGGVLVRVDDDSPHGDPDDEGPQPLEVYPTVTRGRVTVIIPLSVERLGPSGGARLSLYDALGRRTATLREYETPSPGYLDDVTIPVGIPVGRYTLCVEAERRACSSVTLVR